MLELYGRQWEASYGHVDGDVFPVWCEALEKMKPQQIKSGLDEVIKEGGEFPPNLIKFLRLCRQSEYHTMSPMTNALPAPDVHKRPEVISAKEKHQQAAKVLFG